MAKLGFIVEGHHDAQLLKKLFPDSETVVTNGTKYNNRTKMDIDKMIPLVDLVLFATDPDESGDSIYEKVSKDYPFERVLFEVEECRCYRHHRHKIGIEHANEVYLKETIEKFVSNL